MALIVNRPEFTGTTSSRTNKPNTCFTCKEKKTGVFRLDPNGRPQCFDCMPENEKAIYTQEETG